MKTGLITASYLDPLAVRIESVRLGKGQGWRRFLVFTALTKGRKGSEYVALFTYFSFEGKAFQYLNYFHRLTTWKRGCVSSLPKGLAKLSML